MTIVIPRAADHKRQVQVEENALIEKIVEIIVKSLIGTASSEVRMILNGDLSINGENIGSVKVMDIHRFMSLVTNIFKEKDWSLTYAPDRNYGDKFPGDIGAVWVITVS